MIYRPSGVPCRPGERDDAERIKRTRNASAYKRRVAAKGAAGGAQPMTRPRGPPAIREVPAGVSRPPVNGGAPLGVGRQPVNEGAPAGASAACFSEISVFQNLIIAMQMQLRVMLRVANRPVHEAPGVFTRGLN